MEKDIKKEIQQYFLKRDKMDDYVPGRPGPRLYNAEKIREYDERIDGARISKELEEYIEDHHHINPVISRERAVRLFLNDRVAVCHELILREQEKLEERLKKKGIELNKEP